MDNRRSRHAPKGQRAHSPGQRPGLVDRRKCALKGQKHWVRNPMYSNAFALSGRTLSLHTNPGRCPGLCACWAFSPLLERLLPLVSNPSARQAHAGRGPFAGVQGAPRRGNERIAQGQRPGLVDRRKCALKGQKHWVRNPIYSNVFAPSVRALNACKRCATAPSPPQVALRDANSPCDRMTCRRDCFFRVRTCW